MKLREGCLVLGAFLLMASSAEAGPWVKKPGEVYTKVGVASFEAEESFNQGVSTGLSYTGLTYNLYAEAGIVENLQAVVDLPFVVATNASPQGVNYTQRTLGDARFELNYAILPDFPLTFGVETKIPLYSTIAERNDADIQAWSRSKIKFPDPGDGNIDITPKLLTGYSFYPVPAWITAELGYRFRLDGFSDGIFAAVSGGIFVVPDWVALGVFANTVINIEEDEDPAEQATREFVYVQGYALISAKKFVDGVSLSLGFGNIVYAKNSAAGQDFSLGMSYEF